MKSFSKICRSVSMLNCRSHHSHIKLTHTALVMSEARPQCEVKCCNGQLCMYLYRIYWVRHLTILLFQLMSDLTDNFVLSPSAEGIWDTLERRWEIL